MTTQFLRQVLVRGVFVMAVCAAPQASAGVPIKINAWGVHHGGQIVYRYQIQNNSASTIFKADLGLAVAGEELPGLPWSLNAAYSEVPVLLDAAYCKPFNAMDCSITVFQFDYMPEPKTRISMRGLESSLVPPPKVFSGAENIKPGALSSVAELYVQPSYQSQGYLTASGTVYLLDSNTKNPDGSIVTYAEIPFTKVDVTPPMLSVTLSPATIWPPNDKLVTVTAAITVTDDYDPQPEIKLESITANEVLDKSDIKAHLGIDDRQFQLKAEREGKNKVGRIYTVTYSATDGSGNKTLATATVTVPHDREEEESQGKRK